MSDLTEFQAFPKIPRWHKDVIVTEKIDGTNACVIVPPEVMDGAPLIAQSRNRIITPEQDNAGFARWVAENTLDIVEVLGIGRHYGEWWGQGIQRNYGLTEKRFTPFRIRTFGKSEQLSTDIWSTPELAASTNPEVAIDRALAVLRTNGSFAAEGWDKPEGVVVYHSAAKQMFKVILNDDGTVNSVPKGVAA